MKFGLEPDTKETIVQLNPVTKGEKGKAFDPNDFEGISDYDDSKDLTVFGSQFIKGTKYNTLNIIFGGATEIAFFGTLESNIATGIDGSIVTEIVGFTNPGIWVYSNTNDDVFVKWSDTYNFFWTKAKAISIKSLKIVKKTDLSELVATFRGDEQADYDGTSASPYVEYDRITSTLDGNSLIGEEVDITFYTSTDATGDPIDLKAPILDKNETRKRDFGDIEGDARDLIGTLIRVEIRDPTHADHGRIWLNTTNGKTFHNAGGVWNEDPKYDGIQKTNSFSLTSEHFGNLTYTGFTKHLFSGHSSDDGVNYHATWGEPKNYLQDSDLNNIIKILLAQIVDCSFSNYYEGIESLFIKTVDLTTSENVPSISICGLSTTAVINRIDRRRLDEIIFYTPSGVKYYKFNTSTSVYEDVTLTTNVVASEHRTTLDNEGDGVLRKSKILSDRTDAITSAINTAIINVVQATDIDVIEFLTQVEFDAIVTKSDDILYYIPVT